MILEDSLALKVWVGTPMEVMETMYMSQEPMLSNSAVLNGAAWPPAGIWPSLETFLVVMTKGCPVL